MALQDTSVKKGDGLFFTRVPALVGKETADLAQLIGIGVVRITGKPASILDPFLADLG